MPQLGLLGRIIPVMQCKDAEIEALTYCGGLCLFSTMAVLLRVAIAAITAESIKASR
jgi:hypothetical protein